MNYSSPNRNIIVNNFQKTHSYITIMCHSWGLRPKQAKNSNIFRNKSTFEIIFSYLENGQHFVFCLCIISQLQSQPLNNSKISSKFHQKPNIQIKLNSAFLINNHQTDLDIETILKFNTEHNTNCLQDKISRNAAFDIKSFTITFQEFVDHL